MYTFITVWFATNLQSLVIPWITVAALWLFTILFSTISFGLHNSFSKTLYDPTPVSRLSPLLIPLFLFWFLCAVLVLDQHKLSRVPIDGGVRLAVGWVVYSFPAVHPVVLLEQRLYYHRTQRVIRDPPQKECDYITRKEAFV